MDKKVECNLPDIGVSGLDTGGVTWKDRSFVEDALEKAGAVITDAGFGCGGADLGFQISGVQFGLTLKRR